MDNCNALSLNILWAAREHDLNTVEALWVMYLHLSLVHVIAVNTVEQCTRDPDEVKPTFLVNLGTRIHLLVSSQLLQVSKAAQHCVPFATEKTQCSSTKSHRIDCAHVHDLNDHQQHAGVNVIK